MRYKRHAIIFFTIFMGVSTLFASRADILIENFEGSDFGSWTVEGDAFGPGPSRGGFDWQWPVIGYEGDQLANSYANGDGALGQLTSPPFTVQRTYINFLIGLIIS